MSYLNILFWNVQKKDLTTQLVNLAHTKNVDILILAENPVSSVHLIQALNLYGPYYFQDHPRSLCPKITIVTKFHYNLIEPIGSENRHTIRHIQLPTGENFLLTALHLESKRNSTTESQSVAAELMRDALIKVEKDRHLDRHIVVGDFNMNPFETGMIKANGFHGTMSSEVASRGSRIVQTREYPYFYNPTWSLFGDLNKDVSGTHYYKEAKHISYEWNIFDQVLVRPSLIPNFVKNSLEIIQTDGVTSLITKQNRPNQKTFSDHLPLFFTLKF